ncbi:MAG TPA: hypothetical protein VH681_14390 [Nitrospiraceae bacterium]
MPLDLLAARVWEEHEVEVGVGVEAAADEGGKRPVSICRLIRICSAIVVFWCATPDIVRSADNESSVRQHADQSFQDMKQIDRTGKLKGNSETTGAERNNHYPSDLYWVGKGQGDLSKGKTVCQRVSELSARTDLAKQIRVMVKEHMVDRVRERSGHDTEQDIELTREEIVQEYLQGVKIVDHQVDEENKTCSATAVMSKTQLPQKRTPEAQDILLKP